MRIVYLSLLFLLPSIACFAITDAEIDQEVTRHLRSSAFKSFYSKESQPGHHVYYTFMAWWQQERVKENLDSGGDVTYALLTRAAGFGGWNTSQTAGKEETTIYQNAAFLHYWDKYDALVPTTGSPGVIKILSDARDAALERQCLLLPHHWLYPKGTNVKAGEEPWEIESWLSLFSKEGWAPHSAILTELLDQRFSHLNHKISAYWVEIVHAQTTKEPEEASELEAELHSELNELQKKKKYGSPFKEKLRLAMDFCTRVYSRKDSPAAIRVSSEGSILGERFEVGSVLNENSIEIMLFIKNTCENLRYILDTVSKKKRSFVDVDNIEFESSNFAIIFNLKSGTIVNAMNCHKSDFYPAFLLQGKNSRFYPEKLPETIPTLIIQLSQNMSSSNSTIRTSAIYLIISFLVKQNLFSEQNELSLMISLAKEGLL